MINVWTDVICGNSHHLFKTVQPVDICIKEGPKLYLPIMLMIIFNKLFTILNYFISDRIKLNMVLAIVSCILTILVYWLTKIEVRTHEILNCVLSNFYDLELHYNCRTPYEKVFSHLVSTNISFTHHDIILRRRHWLRCVTWRPCSGHY